jgi:hypothetical protein
MGDSEGTVKDWQQRYWKLLREARGELHGSFYVHARRRLSDAFGVAYAYGDIDYAIFALQCLKVCDQQYTIKAKWTG